MERVVLTDSDKVDEILELLLSLIKDVNLTDGAYEYYDDTLERINRGYSYLDWEERKQKLASGECGTND